MSGSIFSIAISGINAAQTAMSTTAHNITSAKVPQFSRQDAVQATNFAQQSGAGFIGQGVNVSNVRRAYSEFISTQTNAATAQSSSTTEYSTQVQSLLDRIGDPDVGLNSSLSGFYSALQDFSVRPADSATRQTVLSAATLLAGRFQSISSDLSQLQGSINTNIESIAGSINGYVSNIASLNDKIATASAGGNGTQLPNDLLDQRDNLVRELNGLVGVTVANQSDGAANIYLSNGQALVVGNNATLLGTQRDASTPTGLRIGVQTPGGLVELNTTDLTGGKISALISFQKNELSQTADQLGQLAIKTASAFNAQQQFGVDRNGATGTPLFALGQPRTFSNAGNAGSARLQASIADVRPLAASDYSVTRSAIGWDIKRLSDNTQTSFTSLPQTVDGLTIQLQSGTANTGDSFLVQVNANAALDMRTLISDPRKLAGAPQMELINASANTGSGTATGLRADGDTASNFTAPVSIVFTAPGAYQIQQGVPPYSTGTYTPPSGVISLNGWSFDLKGTPAAGDTYTVQPLSADAAGDNRNAAQLAALSTAQLFNGQSLTEGFAGVVTSLANRARQLNINDQAQSKTLSQLQDQEQSVSGVNLDEEASNLIREQQAYQAAGKLLNVASTLFQDLLDAL